MKIKLMITLAVLALVFGLVFIACDNGDLPTIKEGDNETILDKNYVSYIDKDGHYIGHQEPEEE